MTALIKVALIAAASGSWLIMGHTMRHQMTGRRWAVVATCGFVIALVCYAAILNMPPEVIGAK